MREISCVLLGLLIAWFGISFLLPAAGFNTKMWILVVSASVGGIFAGLLVLLGATIVEDAVKVVFLLVLTGILWATTPKLGFVFLSAVISGVTGAVMNQICQYAANRALQSDAAKKREFEALPKD